MKPDTFDFWSLTDFLQQQYPLNYLIISPHMIEIEKGRKQSLSDKVQDKIKSNNIPRI